MEERATPSAARVAGRRACCWRLLLALDLLPWLLAMPPCLVSLLGAAGFHRCSDMTRLLWRAADVSYNSHAGHVAHVWNVGQDLLVRMPLGLNLETKKGQSPMLYEIVCDKTKRLIITAGFVPPRTPSVASTALFLSPPFSALSSQPSIRSRRRPAVILYSSYLSSISHSSLQSSCCTTRCLRASLGVHRRARRQTQRARVRSVSSVQSARLGGGRR